MEQAQAQTHGTTRVEETPIVFENTGSVKGRKEILELLTDVCQEARNCYCRSVDNFNHGDKTKAKSCAEMQRDFRAQAQALGWVLGIPAEKVDDLCFWENWEE